MAHDARTAPYGNGRTSPQRENIVRIINSFGHAFTAEELVAALSDAGVSSGVATVYRALAALEETGYVARVGDRDGATLYARCETSGHHHHMVCVACGYVAPASCPVDDATIEAAARAGFLITDHEITLYGVCRDCLSAGWDGEVH